MASQVLAEARKVAFRFVHRCRCQRPLAGSGSGPEGSSRASQRLVVSTVGEGFSLESNRGWVSEQTSAEGKGHAGAGVKMPSAARISGAASTETGSRRNRAITG